MRRMRRILSERGARGFARLSPPRQRGVVGPEGDAALRQALNAYLRDLRQSPAWSRLIVKYFGEDALAVLGRRPAN
jgi:hypothetical protein